MPRKSKKPGPDLLNPEEETIDNDVKSTPLPTAILAAFTGGKIGRAWKVGELERKLQGLGFQASRRSVTLALAELEAHLSENEFLPWILVERGNQWQLVSKSVILATIENGPGLPVNRILSEQEKAVLLVVIGHRKKGGVTKTALSEILPRLGDIGEILERLKGDGLIYADPVKYFDYWRARPAALLALHLRSHTEIPELKELELYFENRKPSQLDRALNNADSRGKSYARRRAEQAKTLPYPDEEVSSSEDQSAAARSLRMAL
jgi:hypothetical protein